MIRTVPETTGEGIELYIRTYYSSAAQLGRHPHPLAGRDARGHAVEPAPGAEAPDFDASAFTYAALRLPDCIYQVRRVVMGQSEEVFIRGGLRDIATWQRVDAAARRRRMLFDGQDTVAAFVSSVSDIDDLIPCLTAYQIEWNKLHRRLARHPARARSGRGQGRGRPRPRHVAAARCGSAEDDMERLQPGVGRHWDDAVRAAGERDRWICGCNSLASGFNDYRKAVEGGGMTWCGTMRRATDLESQPGLLRLQQPAQPAQPALRLRAGQQARDAGRLRRQRATRRGWPTSGSVWRRRRRRARRPTSSTTCSARYHASGAASAQPAWRQAEADAGHLPLRRAALAGHQRAGHRDLPSSSRTSSTRGCTCQGWSALADSNALIVNVDYPLGFAAYHLLLADRLQRRRTCWASTSWARPPRSTAAWAT